jgi:hypothetical protein
MPEIRGEGNRIGCSGRYIPIIGTDQMKVAFTMDIWRWGTATAQFEPTVWFPTWRRAYSPVNGDSGSPYFMVIGNDLVLVTPVNYFDPYKMMADITLDTGGTLRNDFLGWVGVKFTVGMSDILVNALCRWKVAGNTGTHTVKIVNTSGSTVASVDINMNAISGSGEFVYGGVAATLSANTTYYLVSHEATGAGVDQWYDYGAPRTSAYIVTVDGAAYCAENSNTHYTTPGNFMYGPVSFRCKWGGGGTRAGYGTAAINGVISPYSVTEENVSGYPDM